MTGPARDARDAGLLLAAGLLLLSVLAAVTYRPGGPRWPHVVVDGGTWLLLLVTTTVLLVSACRAVHRRWPRG